MNRPHPSSGERVRQLVWLLGALLLAAPLSSALADEPFGSGSTEPLPYLEELPPPLDRALFFDDPEIAAAQVSPDGAHISFMRPYDGVRTLWIKGAGDSFEDARPLTADDRPVPGDFWSQDSRYLLYVQDMDGDENYHVWAVDPSAEPDTDTGVPPARNLTDIDGVRATIIAVPRGTPDRMLVGLNDRDPALHDVHAVEISTGERELLVRNDRNIAGWSADLSGTVRLAVRQTSDGGTEILPVRNGDLGEPIFACAWTETCSPIRFLPNGEQVWLMSNAGADVDLTGLYRMDVATGETELFERDPEGEVDLGGAYFHPATDELLATVYVGDRPRIYPHDDTFATDLELLRGELPEGEIGLPSQSQDGGLALVSLSRDVDPGSVYVFDRERQSVELLYRSRPDIPVEHMAEMEPIRYTARDGLEIPAYLSLPRGVDPEDLGVVVLVHGGPWARDSWGYRAQVQFLANRGYAVLQPNFRGSSGYGKSFLNVGNLEWGDAMQDDVTDGVAHLVELGIADPDRVCIMGASYGGYSTLAGMTFTPELYACGVNIVGISNLITLINSIPPYWGPIRQQFVQRMGDPDTQEGHARLERQSPINHVEHIEAPLLVIHGANDPRVRQAEADQIVVAMRDAALPVEYIVAPDEGRGFSRRENRLAMYARTEAFLADHLGGRHQPDMPAAIAERLAQITVDVDTVEVADLADALDAARTNPLPAVDGERVATGKFGYTTRLEAHGDQIDIESTRTIRRGEVDGREVLEIASTSTTPMGETRDHYLIDARTLHPLSREIQQGQATVEIDFGHREVTGEIRAIAQEMPVAIALEAPVFGDQAALEAVLTALPLDPGYRSPVRVTEIGEQQRVRFFAIEVAAEEVIEVPAGDMPAWRTELSPLDDEGGAQTVWVSTDGMLLRVEGGLPPAMGGGTFVTELVSVGD